VSVAIASATALCSNPLSKPMCSVTASIFRRQVFVGACPMTAPATRAALTRASGVSNSRPFSASSTSWRPMGSAEAIRATSEAEPCCWAVAAGSSPSGSAAHRGSRRCAHSNV